MRGQPSIGLDPSRDWSCDFLTLHRGSLRPRKAEHNMRLVLDSSVSFVGRISLVEGLRMFLWADSE